MNKGLPKISIIVVNHNGERFLKNLFGSIFALDYPKDKIEVTMVDNCSQDGSIDFVRNNFPKIKIIKNDINNYCLANNIGIRESRTEFIAFLNNDTEVDKGWLLELVKAAQLDQKIGAVGSKILSMNGDLESLSHAALPDFYWQDAFEEDRVDARQAVKEAESISGCAVLCRRKALKEIDYFDEDFNMYLEDVDLSIRLRNKGWKIVYAPAGIVRHIHRGSGEDSLATFYTERNRLLLLAKHYPKKLSQHLIGKGYFTKKSDFANKKSFYDVLADVLLKLMKHNKKDILEGVLKGLLLELKKIDNIEKEVLINKIKSVLDEASLLKWEREEKDKYIISLISELKQKDLLITQKDNYTNSLALELEKQVSALGEIYNSTIFKYFVSPLWRISWKIKQKLKIADSNNLSQAESKSPSKEHVFQSSLSICTIISKNYLSYARTLTESFRKYNRGEVFVLLTDDIDGFFDPKKENFKLIEISSLKGKIKDFDRFCFQYNATELNTAIKPFFLEFLFEEYKLEKVIYLDPDILITDELSGLFELLSDYAIILTPHITRPFPDGLKPNEVDILKSGVYNLGFIALSRSDTSKTLLHWWKDRLKRLCRIDLEGGLFVDQKWLDLVPGFFKDVLILRDEAYNVAYWNLHYRNISIEEDKVLVNGKRAKFIHFSGMIPSELSSVSKHQDRFKLKYLKTAIPVFESYSKALSKNGYSVSKDWPCVFNYFDNGAVIPNVVRQIYWEFTGGNSNRFKDPFIAWREDSYFNWLNEAVDKRAPKMTRFMYEIFKRRSDVQRVYPDVFGEDREAFLSWFLKSFKSEYDCDRSFLDKVYPFNMRKKQQSIINVKTRSYYKLRNIIKNTLKFVFKNNLWIIRNLKMVEFRFTKKALLIKKLIKEKMRFDKSSNSSRRAGVNIFGYLTSELGVGEGARINARCLRSLKINVSLINIDNHSIHRKLDSSLSEEFSNYNHYDINLIHVNADMFGKLYAEKRRGYFKDKYNIGFWNWELSSFPDDWIDSFSYCDEIWTPSNFSLNSISRKSTVPVIKIPFAVSLDNIKKVNRSYFGLSNNEFLFLFVFDFFSYFERKNPLALIDAFKKAFSPDENVRLVIKCSNSNFYPLGINSLRTAISGYKITILDEYLYRDEINALISLCDSYVSLHRSEGFGLTIAEAMYLGKPVIATGYSGNCDYMNIHNSFLIKHKLVEITKDVGPYKKGDIWAQPDAEHAAETLRYLFKNKEAAREIGDSARAYIREALNYNKIGKEIKDRIDFIRNNFV